MEKRKKWSQIRLSFDSYEGWLDNKQFQWIEKTDYVQFTSKKELLCLDLVNFVSNENQQLQPIVLGSILNACQLLKHRFECEKSVGNKDKNRLIETALMYLNTPYLWGGRSSFGIDCSGLVQLSLRRVGVLCPRDTDQQASSVGFPVGDVITNLLRGDLIYMNGHVAIMVDPNTILHSNAFHMSVEHESLDGFLSRLKQDNIHNVQARRPLLPSH